MWARRVLMSTWQMYIIIIIINTDIIIFPILVEHPPR